MQVPEEVKQRHARLSPHFRTLVEYIERNPAHQQWFDLYNHVPAFMRGFYPMQCWPTVVSGAVLDEIQRVTVGVCGLIKTIPERIFELDRERITSYYGLDPHALTDDMLTPPNGLDGAFSRGDFIESEQGLKCLEVNHSAGIGGWQVRFWADVFLKLPFVAQSLANDAGRVTYRDPFQVLLQHVADDVLTSPSCADSELNVALIVPPEVESYDLPLIPIFEGEFQRYLASRGDGLVGKIFFCRLHQLGRRDGKVAVGSTRVHAVVGHDVMENVSYLFRCFKEGTVKVYNGPLTQILRDKRNLALLSENADSGLFDPAERALIENHIAWTRRVAAEYTTYQGERVFLPDLILDRREDLVLKKGFSAQGRDVLIGAALPAAEWARYAAVAEESGDWIVQEWVDSIQYLYQEGEFGSALHDVVWGLFAFGDRFGGAVMRMVPGGARDVINGARGASLGILLEVHEP